MMSFHNDKHYTMDASDVIAWMLDARCRTLSLVSDFSEAQLAVPQTDSVNPPLWELGHVAFFFDAFLLQQLGSNQPVVAGTDELYDSFRVEHVDRWELPLPSLPETLDYMGRVARLVDARLSKAGSRLSPVETYLGLLCTLHEDMHGEAITYTRQTLGYAAPPSAEPEPLEDAGPWPGDVEIAGAAFQLGATEDVPFVFDNEKWAHAIDVQSFRIARAPVTNGEFLDFVEDGGYERRDLWSYEGWTRLQKSATRCPLYWSRRDGAWVARHFDAEVSLRPHAPVVHVSWFEAEAFCKWAGRRLPTQAEWEMAASIGLEADSGRKRRYPWGDDPPTRQRAHLDGFAAGCADVAAYPDGDSARGCRQMLGNVWEWTSSAFYPFPGYLVDRPYREYSAPWFGYQKVLKGGAFATRSRLVNNTYRNFYLPHRADVFAGFRTCAL